MKVAVIGLGFMGATHVRAIQDSREVELCAIVSSDAAKQAGDLSGIHGNLGGPAGQMDFSRVKKFSKYADALADPEIEAVDICLPTYLHAAAAIEALQAGKHVLVEKPMALDGESAQAMIDAAREHRRVLMVAQVLRFFPAYLALENALDSGKLGQVHSTIFRRRCAAPGWNAWLADSSKSGGGVFDLLIHDIDMCLLLFGRPQAVSATGREDLPKGIDLISAELHYDGIPSVTVRGGWHRGATFPFSMEYTVVTDGGTLDYSSAGNPPTLFSADGHTELLPLADVNGYQAEIEYFIQCCREGREPDRCPPEESATTVKLTRALADARNLRGEKVPWRN
jgi:predicted dehydrogenase